MPSTPGICVLLATSMLCPVLHASNRDSDVPYSQSPEVSKTGAGRPQQININRATVAELKTLPGVGEATAKRIVAYRSKNPPFRRIEELLIIRGISRNRLEQIRTRIRLD
jgi:competence ComEA-like helix-hairpin-helix protein